MAYITPKTTWVSGNIPVASDFNRIEGNLAAIVDEACTFQGVKTFNDGIETSTITGIASSGVTVENVLIKSGVVSGLIWGA